MPKEIVNHSDYKKFSFLKQLQALYERTFPKDKKAPFEYLLINVFLHRSTFLDFFDQDCFIELSYISSIKTISHIFLFSR